MIFELKTPLTEETIRKLKVGTIVYLSGVIFTLRDQGHRRVIEEAKKGKKPPIDMKGLAAFHAGPIVKKVDNKWRIISIGPTTSTRMEPIEPEFIKLTGIKMVIGKGGMGPGTAKACRDYGAVYAELTGGTASLITKSITKVLDVHWLDLGKPEALWILEVRKLGPLIVTIDAEGNNLREKVMRKAKETYERIIQNI